MTVARGAAGAAHEERAQFTATLKCPLTEAEFAERAALSAQVVGEIETMRAELKAEMAHRRALIAEREGRLRQLSEELRNRATYRPVDCERLADYRRGDISEVRLDTGEVLRVRPMTFEERQRALPLPVAPPSAPPPPSEALEALEALDAPPPTPRGRKPRRAPAAAAPSAPKPRGRRPRAGVRSPAEALAELED